MPVAAGDAALAKGRGDLGTATTSRDQTYGRVAHSRISGAQQAHAVLGAQVIKQRLGQRRLVRLDQTVKLGQASRTVIAHQRFEVIQHSLAGRDLGVVWPCGVQAFLRMAAVKEMALVGQHLGQAIADHHHALVHAKNLVQAKVIGVTAKLANVRQTVGRMTYPVDGNESPRRSHANLSRPVGDRVLVPDDVTAMGQRDQPGRGAQQRSQGVCVQQAALRVHLPHLQRRARALGHALPDAAVGLMILVRDDHLVAGR